MYLIIENSYIVRKLKLDYPNSSPPVYPIGSPLDIVFKKWTLNRECIFIQHPKPFPANALVLLVSNTHTIYLIAISVSK